MTRRVLAIAIAAILAMSGGLGAPVHAHDGFSDDPDWVAVSPGADPWDDGNPWDDGSGHEPDGDAEPTPEELAGFQRLQVLLEDELPNASPDALPGIVAEIRQLVNQLDLQSHAVDGDHDIDELLRVLDQIEVALANPPSDGQPWPSPDGGEWPADEQPWPSPDGVEWPADDHQWPAPDGADVPPDGGEWPAEEQPWPPPDGAEWPSDLPPTEAHEIAVG